MKGYTVPACVGGRGSCLNYEGRRPTWQHGSGLSQAWQDVGSGLASNTYQN